MTTLRIQDLTAEAFAPYGQVIAPPTGEPDAAVADFRWWGDQAAMQTDNRPFTAGYLRAEPGAPQFDWAERHMRSEECLIPLNGDCLIYVGAAHHPDEPERFDGPEALAVFRVPAGYAVILNKGVWHGAPMAEGQTVSVMVWLLAGTGDHDKFVVQFDAPVQVTS